MILDNDQSPKRFSPITHGWTMGTSIIRLSSIILITLVNRRAHVQNK